MAFIVTINYIEKNNKFVKINIEMRKRLPSRFSNLKREEMKCLLKRNLLWMLYWKKLM
jgi:hypothetical protein